MSVRLPFVRMLYVSLMFQVSDDGTFPCVSMLPTMQTEYLPDGFEGYSLDCKQTFMGYRRSNPVNNSEFHPNRVRRKITAITRQLIPSFVSKRGGFERDGVYDIVCQVNKVKRKSKRKYETQLNRSVWVTNFVTAFSSFGWPRRVRTSTAPRMPVLYEGI